MLDKNSIIDIGVYDSTIDKHHYDLFYFLISNYDTRLLRIRIFKNYIYDKQT